MKKLLAILLVLILSLTMSACTLFNSEKEDGGEHFTTISDDKNNVDDIEEDLVDDNEGDSENTVEDYLESEENTDDGEVDSFKDSAHIDELVLFDKNDVIVTVKEITYDSYSAKLSLVFENNSDQNLKFRLDDGCSVNGYMMPSLFLSCDVSAGKKAKDTISIGYEELMLMGIYEIADIELSFDVKNDDYDDVFKEKCKIETSIATGYDYNKASYRESISSGLTQKVFDYSVEHHSTESMYDKGGIEIVSNTILKNDSNEYLLLLEIENTSNKTQILTASEIYLNGLCVCSTSWSSYTIVPNKTGVFGIILSNVLDGEFWATYGIETVATVELTMQFRDEKYDEISPSVKLNIVNSDSNNSVDMTGEEAYNNNNIRLINKGIVEDSSTWSDDLYLLMLVENNSNKTIRFDTEYGTFSINGFMVSCSGDNVKVESGKSAVFEIHLWSSYLEEAEVSAVDDIETIEFGIEIEDEKYKDIDKADIKLDFKK